MGFYFCHTELHYNFLGIPGKWVTGAPVNTKLYWGLSPLYKMADFHVTYAHLHILYIFLVIIYVNAV